METTKAYNVFKSGPRKGQCKTLQDRIVRYLVDGVGCTEIKNRSKRRAFCKKGQETDTVKYLYFVGKSGAIRYGKNHTTSHDVADVFKRTMEKWEKENGL